MISLAAPFTLDKIVLKGIAPENDHESDEEVLHAFGHEPADSPESTKPPNEAQNESSNAS
jgi:hypothetical protein